MTRLEQIKKRLEDIKQRTITFDFIATVPDDIAFLLREIERKDAALKRLDLSICEFDPSDRDSRFALRKALIQAREALKEGK